MEFCQGFFLNALFPADHRAHHHDHRPGQVQCTHPPAAKKGPNGR